METGKGKLKLFFYWYVKENKGNMFQDVWAQSQKNLKPTKTQLEFRKCKEKPKTDTNGLESNLKVINHLKQSCHEDQDLNTLREGTLISERRKVEANTEIQKSNAGTGNIRGLKNWGTETEEAEWAERGRRERLVCSRREPINHGDPDRLLIQLTDRDTGAAGMICLRALQWDVGHSIWWVSVKCKHGVRWLH